jgi:hypothetical protein
LIVAESLTACESKAPASGTIDSTTQESALMDFMRSCWHYGANSEADDLSVTIVMQMNPDRTLKSAEIVPADRTKMVDPEYKQFAESALRAVTKCGEDGREFPINPARPYSEWSEISARFHMNDLN